ncbi:MAG: hypothetical protein J5502_07390 [Prevotella sp.]|nr:hypothetical protein [Prevotella sp.]
MKKRLLFAFMALCVSVSGFALTEGEFVYTPQGRFKITGANLNANNAFQDMTGWTVIGAGKTLADKFNTVADGYAPGFNSVVSVDGDTADEGMYYKFEPTSADAVYVVSFKLKGAALNWVQTFINGDNTATVDKDANLVKVAGNTAGTYTYPSTDGEVVVNTAEELTEDWQTFYYAIEGDGNARTWFISFTKMATTIEIADLQIAPAMKYADLHQRDAMLEKLNAYKNCYNWSDEVWAKFDGYPEVIAGLEAIGDESGQAELDELIEVANEVLAEFLYENMDDYLSASTDNYLGIKQTDGNTQKVSNYGEWTCLPTGRAFWNSGAYPDLGHFGGNNSWAYSNPNDPMGIYMSKTLDPGSYVFTIESLAALRAESTSNSWTHNEAWNPAYGVASIVNTETGDTIVSVVKGLDSRVYTPFIVPIQITESGTYQIAFKAWCKEEYKDIKNGSVVYVKDATFYGKNDNKYNQKQLAYEANVRTQITTGREQLTIAAGYLADDSYFWGKAALQAVVDDVEPKIAVFEAMSQDDIIATYDRDSYVNSTSDENGLLQYLVYQQATKFIIAANKEFIAVNDTLSSMQAVIDNAETTIKMRLYDAATGKEVLQSAIDKAKALQAQMKASQYSEENAAAIVASNTELNDAVATFTTTIPANCIATIVDIDFEQAVTEEFDFETGNTVFTNPGAVGSMVLSTFSSQAASNQEFEKGYWANGEQLWKGYLRVGNGTGTVTFDPTENGSMGTNILKVACDFYIQGLVGRTLGFSLNNDADEEIFGLLRDYYNGTTTTNTCELDESYIWAKSGGSYNNASPADATDSVTNNPLQKTHFEVILDYGRKSIYCTATSPNGSTTSKEIVNEAIPTKFVLQSNYNNNDRRPWFDNLLIQRITAGATDPFDPTAIENVKAVIKVKNGAIYNLAGQRVGENYKGVVVKDGKKMIQR